MPFPKRKGRPEGSIASGYSKMSSEEKLEYHKEAMREHREQQKRPIPETPVAKNTTPVKDASSSSRAGRNPLDETPMTPHTRSKRCVDLQRRRRKKRFFVAVI